MAYFPNGSSGEVLADQCDDCPLGRGWNDPAQGSLFEDEKMPKPCPVFFVQMDFNYKQVDKGNEDLRDALNLLIDKKGECQTRKLLLECRRESTLDTPRPGA